MKLIYILFFLFISNCTLNKVVKHHGVHFLDIKQKELVVNTTNINDITKILGPPSTKSSFDNDMWIYIERKITKGSIVKLGKNKMLKNNVLILQIDKKGLLVSKDFFDINNMQKLNFSERSTEINYSKQSFVYEFLSSMRQKLNDPLGTSKK